MPTKRPAKRGAAPPVDVKKTPKKKTPKIKRERRVDIEKLRELMKTHKPPQSWYDEDHTGLY